MKYLNFKDKKKRLIQSRFDLRCLILKVIIKNKKIFSSLRLKAFSDLTDITFKFYSKNQLVNRCIFTGRSKGILSKFKMSRLIFLKLGRSNNILDLRKFFV